jgi:hypothetical protein
MGAASPRTSRRLALLAHPPGRRGAGEWRADKKEGHGAYTFREGDVYEGEWRAGRQARGRAFASPHAHRSLPPRHRTLAFAP